LTLSLAIVVVVAIKVVGALLITALLIIPAAAARPLSSTPERMAMFAVIVGVLSILSGLSASWFLDTPAGPTIVCFAAVLFTITNLLNRSESIR
jgi:zinc transport system permease protein